MRAESQSGIRPLYAGPSYVLGRVVAVPLAALVSLLPAMVRQRFDRDLPLAFGTAVSALAQIGLVVWWAVGEYAVYPHAAGESPALLAGSAHFIGFLLGTPVGAIAAYGVFEGLIRLGSASVLGEPVGTLPLWLVGHVLAGLGVLARGPGAALCRDIAVVRADGKLLIRTCRERTWNSAWTLDYQGTLYRLVEATETDDSQRPYVYRWERAPRGHLIRRIHRYSPTELLDE